MVLLPTGLTAVGLLACVGVCSGLPCVPVGLQYGLWLEQCPASDLRLQASIHGSELVRGQWGRVRLDARALWVEGEGANPRPIERAMNGGVALDLALIREGQGQGEAGPTPGLEVRKARWTPTGLHAELKLPNVPDGDYRLRATVDAGFETVVVDAELALYAPALVHVMSDRPLYQPGQEVLLRSAVLRRTDSAPIEHRPGRWRVRAPDGTEMLVEKGATDAWGVASTSFPLDGEAEIGVWTAAWETGGTVDLIRFEVRPFKLPRFTVQVEPEAPWFTVGADLGARGVARYTSGAPVANAEVRVELAQVDGRWPMPEAWAEPLGLRTDREGRFGFQLGEVPADLIERAQLVATVRVTDEAGETAVGAGRLQLSVDGLRVEALTELGAGLVEGANNRAYLQVSTPDGRPLPDAELTLTSPWDPAQPPRTARTDADGVAALQLDPGKPVTIVDPAPPVRVRPHLPDAPSLARAERLPDHSLELDERRAFDRLHPAIAACGVWTVGGERVPVGLQVDPAGLPREVVAASTPLGRCVASAVRGIRLPAAGWRTYQLAWQVPDTLQPHLELRQHDAFGPGRLAEQALVDAALMARRCLPRGGGIDGSEVLALHWVQRTGARGLAVTATASAGSGLAPGVLGCVRQAFAGLTLDEPAEDDSMGMAYASLSVPQPPGVSRPVPTTRTGYEFRVAATADGVDQGTGRLVFGVGAIPNLRLRATPSLASPGDQVVVELLRGPRYSDTLPKRLALTRGTVQVATAEVDLAARKATFTLPDDVDGFLEVRVGAARTVIFVQPANALQVALATDAPVYRPGDTARLTVRTTAGEAPTSAAVSLAGVDQTLAQLAPLLGPDDWGRVTVRATGEDVFGRFGPRALQLGQIRGENAAKAVVLKIQALPTDAAGDRAIEVQASRSPDEVEALTASFYRGLEAMIGRVRAWEASAPPGELMTPERCADLWEQTLAAAATAGQPVVDAWGRTLSLRRLPQDLLAQTDPRQVVSDSTRLPEDVTNWPRWVAKEAR